MLVLFYLYISVASLAKIPSVDGYVAVCLVLTIEVYDKTHRIVHKQRPLQKVRFVDVEM